MSQTEAILQEMDKLLDLLIENANKLLKISKQVISEDEIIPLQTQQESLLEKLIEKDDELHKCQPLNDKKSLLKDNIDKKIDLFQELNSSFIDNITSSHGLIQFDKGKLKGKPKKQ